jgi:hypothetical protein
MFADGFLRLPQTIKALRGRGHQGQPGPVADPVLPDDVGPEPRARGPEMGGRTRGARVINVAAAGDGDVRGHDGSVHQFSSTRFGLNTTLNTLWSGALVKKSGSRCAAAPEATEAATAAPRRIAARPRWRHS